MWQPGDVIAWRGIYRQRVWHVQPTIVVKDSPKEIVLTLLPGTECVAPEGYLEGKQSDKRRWNFKDKYWKWEKYDWRTNRLLILLEPDKFYSTMYFWNHATNEFLCYYMNFQVPYERGTNSVDTLDLDLDLIINPDFSFQWKDEEDYQQAIRHAIISSEWVKGIETAKGDIFEKLEKRQYPYDGSWLDWMPDPNWTPPKLPKNWDRV
jgi:protein associated with RNAse G/E